MRLVAVSLSLLLGPAGAATAQTPPGQSRIVVSDAWARATPGAGSTGAAYLTVTDQGAPDDLVGASTPVAAKAQLHQTKGDNGVMRMLPVPDLALASGRPVTFAPGGYHLMLTGLKQPLRKGDSFPLTLTFAHAPPVTVQVRVEGVGATEPTPSDMPGMDMGGTP